MVRVAVLASNDGRRHALTTLVARMTSLALASSHVEADVILSDGEFDGVDSERVVVIGGNAVEAAGLLPADAGVAQIEAALLAVAAGLQVRGREQGFEARDETWPPELLTPRELEVLSAMAKGQSNKEIARSLSISLHTVKFHVEAIFRKLGVRARAEAVARGLFQLDL